MVGKSDRFIMKEYRLEAPSDKSAPSLLVQRDAPMPIPARNEVRIRVRAASLNYRDLIMLSGGSASGGLENVIPLSDGAGEIDAVGEGVTDWTVGDRVAGTFFRDWIDGPFENRYHSAARGGSCHGMLAEAVIAPAHSLVSIPMGMSYSEAATLPCAALTAWHALMERTEPTGPGRTVLCLGTGGVSIFALQIAKAAGAHVIITSSSDEKLERARALGADTLINYHTHPEWDREVWRITEKRGADIVIEVGGPGTLPRSLASVAAGGSIALIGVLTGFGQPEGSLFPLVSKNAEMHGIYVGSRAMFERMNHFLTEHSIRPVIDSRYSFGDAATAYERIKSGRHLGKVVVESLE